MATAVSCPHCGAESAAGAFCEQCGKALPTLRTGPRILTGDDFAGTAAGQKLQLDELHKQAKKATTALMWVAIIQTAVIGILMMIGQGTGRMDRVVRSPAFVGVAVAAVAFWCLFVWARRQPLPAAIVGLVLYATLVLINVIVSVSNMAENGGAPHGGGFGGIGIGWLDIVIMVILGQAISAGVKYRKLAQQGGGGFPVV